jgi:hypothetical protein
MHLVLFSSARIALIIFEAYSGPKTGPVFRAMPQAVFFFSPWVTTQRLSFEIGLLSSIHT